jgi:hypothetical protein
MTDPQSPLTSASLAAQVNLVPKASQTFLVSISVLAGLCVVCGAILLFSSNEAGWAFVALASVLMCGALWAWRSSQSDIDLHSSAPTTLSLSDGTNVSTDSRTLRSKEAVAGLLQLCEAHQRVPLPVADGIVESGMVVPDSAAEAQLRITAINDVANVQAEAFDELVNGSRGGPVVTQRRLDDLPRSDTDPSTRRTVHSVQSESLP